MLNRGQHPYLIQRVLLVSFLEIHDLHLGYLGITFFIAY
jgi:hypothetical protein